MKLEGQTVTVFKWERDADHKPCMVPDYEGIFSAWAVDGEELESGWAAYTQAITLKKDGMIALVSPNLLQFQSPAARVVMGMLAHRVIRVNDCRTCPFSALTNPMEQVGSHSYLCSLRLRVEASLLEVTFTACPLRNQMVKVVLDET